MSPVMIRILTLTTVVTICQFGLASLETEPLTVWFENSTTVHAVNGSKMIDFRCLLNRGILYMLNNNVDVLHVDPVTMEETKISTNTYLVKGSPQYYNVHFDLVKGNPNSVMLTFTILTVRYQDNGIYRCHVHSGEKSDSTEEGFAEREVVVHRPLSSLKLKVGDFDPVEMSPKTPLYINPGNYKLWCVAQGSYPATDNVQLYFNGLVMDDVKSVITPEEGGERKFKTEVSGRLDTVVSNSSQELVCKAKDSTSHTKTVSLTINVIGHSAVRVDAVPQNFNNLLTDEINVTCSINQSFHSITNISSLELGLKGQTPLLSLSQSKPGIDTGVGMTSNMKAEGRIDKSFTKSYLKLNIKDPRSADVGVFICRIFFYVNGSKTLQENRAYKRVSADNDTVTPVLVHVLDQLSILQNIVTDQQVTMDRQKSKISIQESLIMRQEEKIDSQEKKITSQEKKITSQEEKINSQERKITNQEQKLDNQERKITSQDATIDNQERKIMSQERKITSLERRITSQEQKIDNHERKITSQKQKLDSQERNITSQKQNLDSQERKITRLEKEMNRQDMNIMDQDVKISQIGNKAKQILQRESHSIAFLARYDDREIIGKRKPLVFRDVVTNIGNAYDKTTGVFTTPTKGLYFFSLVACTDVGKDRVIINLEVNKIRTASLYAHNSDKADQVSTSLVLLLNPGDRVRTVVYEFSGTNKLDKWGPYSLFSGYLLKVF